MLLTRHALTMCRFLGACALDVHIVLLLQCAFSEEEYLIVAVTVAHKRGGTSCKGMVIPPLFMHHDICASSAQPYHQRTLLGVQSLQHHQPAVPQPAVTAAAPGAAAAAAPGGAAGSGARAT
jgi:hypothetical protein